jgi:Tol biopolymer transport system component
VWRLETDGVTLTQITHEQAGVEDFSVSSINGNLALISDNQLFLLDSDGENRRLIADDSQVDKESEDYGFRGFIENPVFSPDGQTLAYAFDGLHLYDLATGEDEHVLTNLGNLLGEPFVFVNETYTPGPWSPDGSQLLIVMGYFEGSTLAVMDTGAELSFRRIYSSGAVCCTYHWSADSRYVLVANPYYLVIPPGLWRYDANTGQETVLVTGLNEDSPFHFVGWPFQHISGDLIFFHAHLKRFSPDKGIPLIMVSSNPDGSDQTQVRSEEFRINGALWAEDGSFALILQPDGDSRQLILARTDGRPLQTLIKGRGIRKITWGP